jgi:hypothetical protein
MKKMAGKKHYDWAQAIVSLACTNSTDLRELAKAAELDPLAGDLSDMDLSDLDLSGQNFAGWNLRHAKLANAKLTKTELRNAIVDLRELIQATDWEKAELDENVRKEAMQLKEQLDAFSDIGFNPGFLRKISELELSVRTDHGLVSDNIAYVGDLVLKSEAEVLRIPNVGRKRLNEIKEVLAQMGLHLGMETPGWPPENIDELVERFKDR